MCLCCWPRDNCILLAEPLRIGVLLSSPCNIELISPTLHRLKHDPPTIQLLKALILSSSSNVCLTAILHIIPDHHRSTHITRDADFLYAVVAPLDIRDEATPCHEPIYLTLLPRIWQCRQQPDLARAVLGHEVALKERLRDAAREAEIAVDLAAVSKSIYRKMTLFGH